jgi:hypothetical protein
VSEKKILCKWKALGGEVFFGCCCLTCPVLLLLPVFFWGGGVISKNKNLCQDQCPEAFLLFSSSHFKDLGFTFKSLIRFELTFAYGERQESSFKFFCMWIPVILVPFFWGVFCYPMYDPAGLVEKSVVLTYRDLFLLFLFVSLTNVSDFMPVPCFSWYW